MMKEIDKKELKKIIESGHINLLVGAGCSRDYLKSLGDIETRMNGKDEGIRRRAQKEYYSLIKKSKAILNKSLIDSAEEEEKINETEENYNAFLKFWADTISNRYLHIVNKQVNIFTTNFDMFMEASCEQFNIPYNDGFSGQINPTFRVENFNKIQKYKSLQFDNTSDIPLFNIIKLHGSVSWETKNKEIIYSNGDHIPGGLDSKIGDEFDKEYKKINVINPNAEKHIESVMNTIYAAMLRKFVLELEKENSVLIIVGFSLRDKHIENLLYGVMKSNPTLVVIYFSHSKYDADEDRLDEEENYNLYVESPKENESHLSFKKIIEYFSSMFPKPK